ncbi:MAG: stage III sporulation protein AG [Clostridiales bacterium]|nr:stage III sporulation protein AG [Clostridiales bacterium]
MEERGKKPQKKLEEGKVKSLWMTLKNMGGEKWILLVLAGILLVVSAIPAKKVSNNTNVSKQTELFANQKADYALQLEQKLKRILEQMDGVGAVEVMITLQSSEEKVIDKNVEQSEQALTEQDKEGGTRISKEMQRKEDTVLVGNSSNQEPYIIKEINPIVEGVVILADGADSPSIVTEINEAVQALFDISPHKIKVLKRKT